MASVDKASSHLIPIARVEFLEGINLPGVTPKDKDGRLGQPQYPAVERIVFNVEYDFPRQLIGKAQRSVFLDQRYNCIVIEHPVSHEQERVPMVLVKQYRFLTDENMKKPAAVLDEAV